MSEEEDSMGSSFSIDEFEDFCSSDDLSMDEMRRMTKGISPDGHYLYNSSFLHRVCMNKNITSEVVEYLLDLYSSAIYLKVDLPGEDIKSAYPLHLACYNKDCPNEVIRMLLKQIEIYGADCGDCMGTCGCKEYFLKQICCMYEDWGNTELGCDAYGGTPLHYYLSRTSNVDLDIVKRLVANPEMLILTDEETKCTPIHIIMHNKSIRGMYDVLRYLVKSNPSSLQVKDEYDQTPLHVACGKSCTNTRTIQILLKDCQDAVYQRNDCNALPIHNLCDGKGDDDSVARDNLKLLLDAHPDSVTQTDDEGDLPIHKAANNKSQAFCKVLVDAYPESVRRGDVIGSLPFHNACGNGGRLDTVEYLFGLYPESLHIRDNYGYLPIHLACDRHPVRPDENTFRIIYFLLRHDPECLSKPVVSDNRGDEYRQGNGAFPFHIVCSSYWDQSNVTKLLFDVYPEAILKRNGLGKLPIDIVKKKLDELPVDPETGISNSNKEWQQRLQYIISFLQTQMSYAKKALNKNAMSTIDITGYLPLHNALRAKAPLGSIKLLVKGNPDAVYVPDGSGTHPLDIASQFSTVGVVKYLAKLSPDRLNACDVNKNYPLHHACRGGNCKVIRHLIERPLTSASVSERNADDMLPFHLFCDFVNGRWCEGETPEYTETIWRLLTAYPETVLNW